MQKINTALLLVVIALLVVLLLRPQVGRYQVLRRAAGGPYLLDTATGKIVMMDANEQVRQYWKSEDDKEKAE